MRVRVPPGWKAVVLGADFIVVRAPEGAEVTLDFARRVFRLGTATRGAASSSKLYTKRNWQQRLCDDAMAFLRRR